MEVDEDDDKASGRRTEMVKEMHRKTGSKIKKKKSKSKQSGTK